MQDLGIRVLFDGENGVRLLLGLIVTLKLSVITIIASCLLGTLMGLLMTLRNPIIHTITRVYLEFIRIMPQLVLLFVTYFGLTRAVGINLSGFTAAVIVFILWGTAEMGDLVRGAFISIPKNQFESGTALGFSKLQLYRFIILPQALRQIIPPAMNLATRMIMTTSLVVLIGVVEMLKTGQQIIEANRYTAPSAALWIYGTIFFLYFLSCWPLTILAQHLEKKWEK
ncbi:amino acid ABC transporter permease [Pectinatus frisingensis]|jgi:polar amino acid transport system permease protein|uniref:amino acid ABC transporter permease n=1 Tax=Pectinatus frisingensis TaxID=865 RepID=UPI0015F3CFF8|nr:amino acid ABC transporter permease [Pectinatus frisingensis]